MQAEHWSHTGFTFSHPETSVWARKLVSWLRRPCTRVLLTVAWFALASGGLAVSKRFQDELQTNVPPCEGTPSYEAQSAFNIYFPDQPINAAIFMKAADASPLLQFVPTSTCGVAHDPIDVRDHTITLHIICENSSALGGGCATTDDLTKAMFALVADLDAALRHHMSPQDAKKLEQELLAALLSSSGGALPGTTHCPEPVAGELTWDWLDYVRSMNESLVAKLPEYTSKVESLAAIPSVKTDISAKLGRLSPKDSDWTANISVALPSGQLWGLFQDQFLADALGTSLVATLHSGLHGEKLLPVGDDAKRISKALVEIAQGAPSSLHAKASSLSLMGTAIFAGIDRTMKLSAMTVPLALLVLAGMVRNLRLVLVTIVNLALCYASAVLFMYPISQQVTTATTAPALMVAVALAMSIDYSLFLLTRFQKEVALGNPADAAVVVMIGTSGRIVFVSGLTLLLCFLMMLCLPVTFISSMGISAAITVLMAVLVALTFTPTVLLTFPSFFSNNKRWGLSGEGCCAGCRCCRCCRSDHHGGGRVADEGQDGQCAMLPRSNQTGAGSNATAAGSSEAACTTKRTMWLPFGACVQRFSWVVLALLLAVAIPLAVVGLPRFRHAIGFMPMMPSDAEATRTVRELQKSFGVGSVFPTTLLAVPPQGATSEGSLNQWLADSCQALKDVARAVDKRKAPGLPAFTAAAFTGVMILDGDCTAGGLGGRGQWSSVGGPRSATKVAISYEVDPFSTEGQLWAQHLREAVDEPSARAVAKWHVFGAGPEEMDVADKTFARLPLMIGLMMVVVFAVIAASTRSLIAPLRAVFCLLWMLVVTLSLAIFTFQNGMLSFLNWGQLDRRESGAMSWMSPCMAVSVLVGLGLDYDIFYSERVIEEWKQGQSERAAALRALGATANTISAAGLIMVVAFLALLLCTTPSLNEISFMLIVGILIDCLVATKVIIPCAMALLGKANFWPRHRVQGALHTLASM